VGYGKRVLEQEVKRRKRDRRNRYNTAAREKRSAEKKLKHEGTTVIEGNKEGV